MSTAPPSIEGPLLIAGGYGLVGRAAARLLRRRHPGLQLALAGRDPLPARPLAEELGASLLPLDVTSSDPLNQLRFRPAAILAAVSDPLDQLVAASIGRGIPIADINRGSTVGALDVVLRALRGRAVTPVLMCGAWMAGLTAILSAAAARALGAPDRIDVTVFVSSEDRVGPDAWGFSRRLAWPYHAMRDGRRIVVQPLTGSRLVRGPDGKSRPAVRISTLEQATLPITLSVATVETRLCSLQYYAVPGLIALKRSGALRAFELPGLAWLRDRLLQTSGRGDAAGIRVEAQGAGCQSVLEVVDFRGQSHLSAVGATLAAEELLGCGVGSLPAGVSFPEQSIDPDRALALLAEAGAVVRAWGSHPATLNPTAALPKAITTQVHPSEIDTEPEPIPEELMA